MGQRLTDYRLFWQQFRAAYHTTGAVLPSGPNLCAALSHFVRNNVPSVGEATSAATASDLPTDRTRPRRILEVGPGTGVVTTHIARSMRPNDHLTIVELNDEFAKHLQEQLESADAFQSVRGRVELVHDSVENVSETLPFDLIISGLPLNNFSVELVGRLLAKMQNLLAPQGVLSFFEYIAIRRVKALVCSRADRERLRGIETGLGGLFQNFEIRRDMVLLNVPPAWVHHLQVKPLPTEQKQHRREQDDFGILALLPCPPTSVPSSLFNETPHDRNNLR